MMETPLPFTVGCSTLDTNPRTTRRKLNGYSRHDGFSGMGIVDFVDALGLKCIHDPTTQRNRLADTIAEGDSHGNPDRKAYLGIESKVITWADKVRIPLDGLDWLLWKMAKGIAPE